MRLVLDTNVLISALLFRGTASRLHRHWSAGRFRLCMSTDTESELIRVLCYPRFALSTAAVTTLVASEVLPFRERVAVPHGPPVCRDTTDDRFLWLAREARADALVTGDADLLSLGPSWEGIPLRQPAEILVLLDDSA